jgi:hypothetical protein
MPGPTNPFDGQHALVPSGTESSAFIRTTPTTTLSYPVHQLRTLLQDRLDRRDKANNQLRAAKQDLDEVVADIHTRHQLAIDERARAMAASNSARRDRDEASAQCQAVHLIVESWWTAEAAKEVNGKAWDGFHGDGVLNYFCRS